MTSHHYHQYSSSSSRGDLTSDSARLAASESSSSGGSMPINFDFTSTVTLFDWTSRNGFEYFVLLAFAFSLAYLQEYLAWIRSKEIHSSSTLESASLAGSKGYESLNGGGGGDVKENVFPVNRRVLQSAKYCAHAAVSYLLMLVVMSLNFGVFASVLLGLGVGKYIFSSGGGSGVGGRRSLMSDACHPSAWPRRVGECGRARNVCKYYFLYRTSWQSICIIIIVIFISLKLHRVLISSKLRCQSTNSKPIWSD